VKHTGENIAEKIACVVEEFSLIDKVFFCNSRQCFF
jgi:hypothetical protein